jgi:hypothetical protein
MSLFPLLESRQYLAVLLVCALGASCFPGASHAAPPAATKEAETPVPAAPGIKLAKARFEILLAAGLFVRWPSAEGEPERESPPVVNVGIVGSEPNLDQIQRMAQQRTISGKQIAVKHFERISDLENCQILLLADSLSENDRLELIEKYRDLPVLLASSAPGFCREGGGLEFSIVRSNVKFLLNSQALARQKLVVDPRFSRLAQPATVGVKTVSEKTVSEKKGGPRP